MNGTPDDGRDPIAQAFNDYQRAPRDVVPRTVLPVDDLAALAGQTVTLNHYEIDDSGITTHTEQITVTAPILKGTHA